VRAKTKEFQPHLVLPEDGLVLLEKTSVLDALNTNTQEDAYSACASACAMQCHRDLPPPQVPKPWEDAPMPLLGAAADVPPPPLY